jgi:hypothetical protein
MTSDVQVSLVHGQSLLLLEEEEGTKRGVQQFIKISVRLKVFISSGNTSICSSTRFEHHR